MESLLPNFFGIRNVDATGDYVPTVLNPRYSEVVAFANQLYREDILTEENFTSQRKQIEEKIASGQVFGFVGNAIDYRIPMQTLYANDPAAKFVPVGAIRTGDHPPTFIVSTGGWATTAVTSQADDPARAVRFLEYLYSEEGQRETMLGVPDEHWTLDERGRERWTPEVIQIRSDDQRAFNERLGIMTFWWTWDTLYKNRYVQYQYQEDADLMWMDIQTALVPYVTITDAFVNIEPDPASELGITHNEVQLFWERELTRAMIAPSRDAAIGIYEEAVDTMVEMGYGDVVDHMNEQFQQNREKYGIDSVY
jgi:putative aldouronate transport system substrate-binding protein